MYADAVKGSDAHGDGTVGRPLRTIAAAVSKTRQARTVAGQAASVILRDSAVFYVAETIVLTGKNHPFLLLSLRTIRR